MHVSSSIVAGSPNNMNQPLELQLGLLGPANSAHPRSQSNRICTLPGLYTYIYIFIYSPPTHFSHLDGRSFSRRLSFHLSSQQLSLLSFSLIMYEKKSSRVLPAHVLLPMHLPVIFHTAVKVQIPLAICNQKYHICNLAELGTLGRIV